LKSVTERRIYDNGTVMTNVLNSERDRLRQIAGENFASAGRIAERQVHLEQVKAALEAEEKMLLDAAAKAGFKKGEPQ